MRFIWSNFHAKQSKPRIITTTSKFRLRCILVSVLVLVLLLELALILLLVLVLVLVLLLLLLLKFWFFCVSKVRVLCNRSRRELSDGIKIASNGANLVVF